VVLDVRNVVERSRDFEESAIANLAEYRGDR
jgi:hypothetical protein